MPQCFCTLDIEQGFLPWLMDRITDQLEKSERGRMVLDGLLREVVNKRRDLYERLEQANQPEPTTADEQKEETAPAEPTAQVTVDTTPPQAAPATTTEV